MFRKPKRKAKEGLRRGKDSTEADMSQEAAGIDTNHGNNGYNNNSEQHDETTSELLSEAKKRVKMTGSSRNARTSATAASSSQTLPILHSYQSAAGPVVTNADLATSTSGHHPDALIRKAAKDEDNNNKGNSAAVTAEEVGIGADGIFRNKQRNKFHAGPIMAAQNVRVTARFDYEPNICKDYKETGFCGFGDTCIYLHDRGDSMTGWQLEQQWEQQQRIKKEQQEKEMQQFADSMTDTLAGKMSSSGKAISTADGLPFACHICRDYFKNPVVTTCQHYFCEDCVMNHARTVSPNCPICSLDMGSVFNQPTKLIAKKRKVLGIANANADDSWEEFYKIFSTNPNSTGQ
jgi:RING finger protein 113A